MMDTTTHPVISLAEVRDRTDPNTNGSFQARISALGNAEKSVYYVSPYASNGEAAFIAIPEDGTQILVCQPIGSSAWYYMGATFALEPRQVDGDPTSDANIMPMDRVDPNIYNARGVPMKVLLKSPNGAGLTISEEYNPEFINRKTELTSTVNKKVTLSDSPEIDSIVLDSGNGATIKITNNPQVDDLAAQSVEIETVGPQKLLNIRSQTDIVIEEGGRELQLINNGNGVAWGEGSICGNVNIQSKWKDVNVFNTAASGRIFIECLNGSGSNQQIVIETNGADGAITIKTNGDVNIDAGKNININAANEIKMRSGGKFSVDCDSFQVQANQVDIDPAGGTIQLANGATPSPPNIPAPESTYGNKGVTTY